MASLGTEKLIGEPFRILAAVGWSDQQPMFSMANRLRHNIHKHPDRPNGLEGLVHVLPLTGV